MSLTKFAISPNASTAPIWLLNIKLNCFSSLKKGLLKVGLTYTGKSKVLLSWSWSFSKKPILFFSITSSSDENNKSALFDQILSVYKEVYSSQNKGESSPEINKNTINGIRIILSKVRELGKLNFIPNVNVYKLFLLVEN